MNEIEIECPLCGNEFQRVLGCQLCLGVGVVRAAVRPLTDEELKSSFRAQEGVSRLMFARRLWDDPCSG